MVMGVVEPHLLQSSLPPVIQLATTLRFLAEGSYQRAVGNDFNVSLGRSTVSKVLAHVLNILEYTICQEWIQIAMNEREKHTCMQHFYEKYKIPGITGCIDGTHVRIIRPHLDEHLYYNRKGYFSMNPMIVSTMRYLI